MEPSAYMKTRNLPEIRVRTSCIVNREPPNKVTGRVSSD